MGAKTIRLLAAVLFLGVAGCARPPGNPEASHPSPTPPATLTPPAAPCSPGDQDRYVYRPQRLQVLQPCLRVTGTVTDKYSTPGTDGDMDLLLQLDAPYQALLVPANQNLRGDLLLEAICQDLPPLIEALRVCASDPDPFVGPFPNAGDRIWVEGRYVLDMGHSAWAELHPIYRWGKVQP